MTNEEQIESLKRLVAELDSWRGQVLRLVVTASQATRKVDRLAAAQDCEHAVNKLADGVKNIALQLLTLRSGGATGGTA